MTDAPDTRALLRTEMTEGGQFTITMVPDEIVLVTIDCTLAAGDCLAQMLVDAMADAADATGGSVVPYGNPSALN